MRNHSQKEEETEINMTPMLDIVFIMLIFFIVTAVFVKEAGVEVFKPKAENAQPEQLASILIAIEADDDIWINRQIVDMNAVRTTVEKLAAENPRGTVVIQADEKSKAGLWMQVYDEVRKAGVPKIATSAEN
jgi:biopolymer transport protein ExbD